MQAAKSAAAMLAVILAVIVALLALSVQAEASPPLRVVDDSGATVTLAQPAARIVSLSPGLTEDLFAIGAGDAVVAVSDYSDYPPAARQLPHVARAQAIDLERIAQVRPDLIVAWGSGYGPTLIDALRRLGVPLYISEPQDLDAIFTTVSRLGVLSGHAGEADAAATASRVRLAALRQRYAGRAPLRAFFQVWNRPLMTIGGHHVISAAFALCGARNVFDQLAAPAPQVALEAVIAADPDLIVTAEAGATDQGGLSSWRAMPALRAVREDGLITLDADRLNRESLRIVDEIAVLCEKIDQVRSRAAAMRN